MESDYHSSRVVGGGTAGMTADERSLSWCFLRQARRNPSQLAVVSRLGSLTYGELHSAAHALARVVAPLMSDQPEPVVLLLDHGPQVVTGALGTLMGGGICAPLDPSSPPARLRAQIDHADPAAIVTSAARAAAVHDLAGRGRRVVILEEALAAGSASADSPAHQRLARDEAPAWLYHTSGSTGRPKAVAVSHRALLHGIGNNQRRLGFQSSDRFTWFALASTGQGALNLLGALLAGGTLYPHAPRIDGLASVPGWLLRERITVYNSPATLFRAIVSLLSDEDRFPDLRILRLGSERVRHSDFEAYRRHCPPTCAFVNRYSSTETGSIAINQLDHASPVQFGSIPVGTPLPGIRVLILDDSLTPVPQGESGQIAVQSERLAIGYWRDRPATDAAFLPVPGEPGGRMYLTGDLGRLRPDGQLEHLGRLDGRVKVRGQRVELDEIEATLDTHPAVRQSAVVVSPGQDGEDRLTAFVVLKPTPPPSPSELRAFLSARLPSSSIPAGFFRLDTLPLAPSGKLDRAACPGTGAELHDDALAAPPGDEIEQVLIALWSEVLQRRVTSVHDDFLGLGGDSLHGTRILARVQARWGVNVSFEQLLDDGTVALLAARIAAARQA